MKVIEEKTSGRAFIQMCVLFSSIRLEQWDLEYQSYFLVEFLIVCRVGHHYSVSWKNNNWLKNDKYRLYKKYVYTI